MLTSHRVSDKLVGGLGTDEANRMLVPAVEIGLDVAHRGTHCVERAAPDGLAGQHAEPGLDHVHPGSAGRGEMKVDVGMLGQPALHRRSLVARRVVENAVKFAAVTARHLLSYFGEADHVFPAK